MNQPLEISLLGELRVDSMGTRVALPASRKTRALLAFLVGTGRPHRRERLCELFWNLPDDPKAALRWSLSKLRKVVAIRSLDQVRHVSGALPVGGARLARKGAKNEAARAEGKCSVDFHDLGTGSKG